MFFQNYESVFKYSRNMENLVFSLYDSFRQFSLPLWPLEHLLTNYTSYFDRVNYSEYICIYQCNGDYILFCRKSTDLCSILSAILDISDTTGAIACELEHVKSDRLYTLLSINQKYFKIQTEYDNEANQNQNIIRSEVKKPN